MIAEKPGQFEFKMTHKVAFIPPTKNAPDAEASKGKEEPVTAANIASRELASTYTGMHSVSIVWHTKWTVKGLQPIKPFLHLTKKLALSPGQCCKLRA